MTHAIDQAIFDIAKVLEVPVLLLALLALAAVILELGSFAVELRIRRSRRFPVLAATAKLARDAIDEGSRDRATKEITDIAWSAPMDLALRTIVGVAGVPGGETRIAKTLADFDWEAQRRLGRTRLLVRAGPALGLMGTLIPLSPALDGLASGKVDELSRNLRVAFSVTVLGLLVGAIAYGLSLYRDRMYGQDLSDLEYVAAVITDDTMPRLAPLPQPAADSPSPPVTDTPSPPLPASAATAPATSMAPPPAARVEAPLPPAMPPPSPATRLPDVTAATTPDVRVAPEEPRPKRSRRRRRIRSAASPASVPGPEQTPSEATPTSSAPGDDEPPAPIAPS